MPTYECELCKYSTKIKTQFTRHLNTNKHKKRYIFGIFIRRPHHNILLYFFQKSIYLFLERERDA